MNNYKIYFQHIFASLYYAKARTLFALLGVMMGIASLVLIVAAIDSSGKKANDVIQRLGPDSVMIFGGNRNAKVRTRMLTLTHEDVKNIRTIAGIKDLNYQSMKKVEVKNQDLSVKTRIIGTNATWLDAWSFSLAYGRSFNEEENEQGEKVCIIGLDAEANFFSDSSIGKTLLINNIPFRIIGVFNRKGQTPHGDNIDERIYIPFGAYKKFIDTESHFIGGIRFRVHDITEYERIIQDTRTLLRKNHQDNDYTLITPEEIKRFLSLFSAGLTLFLGIASLTALVVSGFVLANIFSINVKVRQWEIGLRKAVGGSSKTILYQFLCESLVLAVAGSFIGILIGFGSITFVFPLLDLSPVYPIKAVFIGIGFSLIVGILAAWYPAKSASNITPQEALRGKVV